MSMQFCQILNQERNITTLCTELFSVPLGMDTSELVVTCTKTPSYITSLLNEPEEIILVHKIDKHIQDVSFVSNESDHNKCQEKYLDVTGSPLKVDLDGSSVLCVDAADIGCTLWQKNEESHYPIPLDKANRFITEYYRKQIKNLESKAIWCVCDTEDENRTVLLSALQTPNFVSRTLVTAQGCFPKNHRSIAFEAMCNKHFECVGNLTGDKQKIPLRQLTSSVFNVYEVFGSKPTTSNFDNNEIRGSVYLEVRWNQCCFEIPIDYSKSVMIVQTVVDQPDSLAFPFWKELILLELYIKALSEYNSETMRNNDWLPSNINLCQEKNLIDLVIETINDYQHKQRNTNRTDSMELKKIIENISYRHTSDITDQLWAVLSQCTTYGALTDCLNVIFTEIANLETDVYVSESNMTTMAQMIRGITAGKIAVPRLTGTQPIEMLIDIGLEKIRKDLVYILSQCGLANLQELNELFRNCNTESDELLERKEIDKRKSSMPDMSKVRATLYHKKPVINMKNIERRMKILGQLHTVLETMILVPPEWRLMSAKFIYEHYVGSESPFDSFATLAKNKVYEVRVELPINKIYDYIVRLNPVLWRFSLTTTRPLYTVQNVFHLSQRAIFPPSIFIHDVLDETLAENSEVCYHYTLLTHVTDYIKTRLNK